MNSHHLNPLRQAALLKPAFALVALGVMTSVAVPSGPPGVPGALRSLSALSALSPRTQLSASISGGMDQASFGSWAATTCVAERYCTSPYQPVPTQLWPVMWVGPFEPSTCSGGGCAGSVQVDGMTGSIHFEPECVLPKFDSIGPGVMGGISYSSDSDGDSPYLSCWPTTVFPGIGGSSGESYLHPLPCGLTNEWLGPKFNLGSRPQLSHWVVGEPASSPTVCRKYVAIQGTGSRMAMFKATSTGSLDGSGNPQDYEPVAFVGVNGTVGAIDVEAATTTNSHTIYHYHDRAGYVYSFFEGASVVDFDPYGPCPCTGGVGAKRYYDLYEACIAGGEEPTGYYRTKSLLDGQLWKITYENGGATQGSSGTTTKKPAMFVGEHANDDLTNPQAAYWAFMVCTGSSPCDAYLTGDVLSMFDSAGRQYVYTYYSSGRIKTQAVYSGSTLLADATFFYIKEASDTRSTPIDNIGTDTDLECIRSRTLVDGSSLYNYKYQYFRYYTNQSAAADAQSHMLYLTMGAEGVRQYLLDHPGSGGAVLADTGDGSTASTEDKVLHVLRNASASSLLKYCSTVVNSYDIANRVTSITMSGGCGCTGGTGPQATYVYTYDNGPSDVSTSNDTYDCSGQWWAASGGAKFARRTTIARPDGSYEIDYYDDLAQLLGKVISDKKPDGTDGAPTFWATLNEREPDPSSSVPSSARIVTVYPPESVTAFSYSSDLFTVTSANGPIQKYTYVATGSGTDNLFGNVIDTVSVSDGSGGFQVQVKNTYLTGTALEFGASSSGSSDNALVSVPVLASRKVYKVAVGETDSSGLANSSNYDLTSYTYTFWPDSGSSPSQYWAPKCILTTYPVVTDAEHGSGSATTSESYYQQRGGRQVFALDTEGHWTYNSYDADSGKITKQVQDALWSDGSADATPFSTSVASTSLVVTSSRFDSSHTSLTTQYQYDILTRPTGTTLPTPAATITASGLRQTYIAYSMLHDQQLVTISGPRTTGTGSAQVYFGPASYIVSNLSGKPTFSSTLAVSLQNSSTLAVVDDFAPSVSTWIDTTKTDPVEALSPPAASSGYSHGLEPVRVTTSRYDESGARLASTRLYTAFGGTLTSSASYDETSYRYDGMSHIVGVKDPTGTIRRTEYDGLGRPKARWIGTDDNSSAWDPVERFVSSGTSSPNMVKTDDVVYASTAVGSGASAYNLGTTLLDHQTRYPSGTATSDQRVTSYTYDRRNRLLFQQNPQSPHLANKYDHRNRKVATATYSSLSGLSVSTDIAASSSSNRLSLSETLFDGRGQVWKSVQHRINQSTGAVVTSNDLETHRWYDAGMKLIKSTGPSGLTKTLYDRLDRKIRQYELARCGDDGHLASAGDVSNDVVLEEQLTGYEYETGNVLMSATVSRHHDVVILPISSGPDPTVMGDLETETLSPGSLASYLTIHASGLQRSGAVVARAQITAMWYDVRDRLTDTAQFGTYKLNESGGPTSFSRSGLTIPTRSATDASLLTSTAYYPNGAVKSTTDPKGFVTATEYDKVLRRVTSIANATGSTSGGVTRDHDVYTRYVYSNGLLTQMWVDLNGNGTQDSDDQVTTYVYGTTKIGSGEAVGISDGSGGYKSVIATGNLLRTTIYPPGAASSATTDRSVNVAYNALGEKVWTMDQNGTTIETDLDTAGRQTARRVTALGGGIDGLVRQIQYTYTNRGQSETVNQLDGTSSGATVLNGVKYTYDDWSNISKLQQDRNGAVASSGGDDVAVTWDYALVAPTGGRPSVRLMSETLPGTTTSDKRRIKFDYAPGTGGDPDSIEYKYGRVRGLKLAAVNSDGTDGDPTDFRTSYEYLGASMLVGTAVNATGRASRLHDNGSPAAYDGLDDLNRTIVSRWTAPNVATDTYHVELCYDKDSNITAVLDPSGYQLYTPATWSSTTATSEFSTVYGTVYGSGSSAELRLSDGLNRITKADRGAYTGDRNGTGTIGGSIRYGETWNLTETGNWSERSVESDSSHSGPEVDDVRSTHSNANEITTRSFNGSSVDPPIYDKAGQMTNDGRHYEYVYDAFGRMVEVKNRSSHASLAVYRYDGLGQRIGWHYDCAGSSGMPDGVLNDSDPWYWFIYDDRWRSVATFRVPCSGSGDKFRSGTADASPKERFVYHAAGRDGRGSSSYIDSLLLSDRDLDTGSSAADGGWLSAGSGTLADQIYFYTNWRNDTIEVSTSTGVRAAQFRYSAYGQRVANPYCGDFNGDGFTDSYDFVDFVTCFEGGACPTGATADVNLDGFVDIFDYSDFVSVFGHDYSTWGPSIRHLYAGYEADVSLQTHDLDGVLDDLYHVRYRVYGTELGRWTRRDPKGQDGCGSLYAYVASAPTAHRDPTGLAACVGFRHCQHSAEIADIDPRSDFPDWQWNEPTPICSNITRKSYGSCYRFAIGCPRTMPVQYLSGSPDIDTEPPGGYDESNWREKPCDCKRQIKQLRDAGLSENPAEPGSNEPPPCKDGYSIALYSNELPCGDPRSARHYRRQETDGTWREIIGPGDPRDVEGPLTEPVQLPGIPPLRFCGFMCRPFAISCDKLIERRYNQ